jgi:predicted glycosyltransferase
MKVWLDILTPKQVMFFKPLVDSLTIGGHDVLSTSRDYREATELARIKNLEIKVVGKHGGEGKYDKLRASASRVFELAELVQAFEPDLAITFSSPEGARVSFGLGIRHYCFNDSPHATAVSKLTAPLTDLLFCPWIIPYSAWNKFGLPKTNIVRYKALDPVAWLKRSAGQPRSHPTDMIYRNGNKKNILVRLEESKAAYLTESSVKKNGYLFLDCLVKSIHDLANIVVICRYSDQVTKVNERYQDKVSVVGNIIDGTSAINSCDLFIGAGGTMTAEACLMGKPAISIAPISFYVERYLLKSGLLLKALKPTDLVKLATKTLKDPSRSSSQKQNAKLILEKMEDPIQTVMRYILAHQ